MELSQILLFVLGTNPETQKESASMSPQRENKKQRSSHTSQKIAVFRRRLDFLRKQQEEHAGEPNGYRAKEIDALGWLLETLSTERCSGCEPGEPPCFTCRVHGVVAARQALDRKNVAIKEAVRILTDGIKEAESFDSVVIGTGAMSAAISALTQKAEVSDVRE